MKKLFASIQNYLQKGESLVLVTVTASRGSVPRGAGARMMVSKEGYVYGSIGGGAVEYEAIENAKELL